MPSIHLLNLVTIFWCGAVHAARYFVKRCGNSFVMWCGVSWRGARGAMFRDTPLHILYRKLEQYHSIDNNNNTRLIALCRGLPGWAGIRKENQSGFTGARDSEWQWHQLGHMQICTSPHTLNHVSIPPLSFLQARCPSCCPANSIKALKANMVAQKCVYIIICAAISLLRASSSCICLQLQNVIDPDFLWTDYFPSKQLPMPQIQPLQLTTCVYYKCKYCTELNITAILTRVVSNDSCLQCYDTAAWA